MNRFYIDMPLHVGKIISLSETVFHHWCRVLRAKVDDHAILFNGQGGEYHVQLIEINKKEAKVHIQSFNPINRDLTCQITLAQVMSKGDRMDYAIQKATELGVRKIQLLTSERCEMRLKYDRDQKKLDHWQSVAIAACEQCGLNRIPEILAPLSLEHWLDQCQDDLKLVMTLSDNQVCFPSPLPRTISILVGPEGGLSPHEIDLAFQQQFLAWNIGQRVLRTETAPVAALGILNMLHDQHM